MKTDFMRSASIQNSGISLPGKEISLGPGSCPLLSNPLPFALPFRLATFPIVFLSISNIHIGHFIGMVHTGHRAGGPQYDLLHGAAKQRFLGIDIPGVMCHDNQIGLLFPRKF